MARFYTNISAKAYADALSVGLYGAAASSNVENAAAVAMGIAPSQLASTIPTNLQIWQAGIALAQSPLFISTYPATLGDAAFITAVNYALTGSTFIQADELASFQSVISQYSMTRAQAATYIVGVIMSVDATTLGLNNQPNPTNPGGVSDLQLFQNQQSAAYNRTLVSGNFANQSANASNLNYPVAGPATNAGYIGAQTAEMGVTFVSSTVVTAQGQISVAAAANNPALITGQAVPTDNITMTTAIETIPAFGTLAINQTVSGVSAAAGGTFQTGDVINGGGVVGNNVVNVLGNGQATAGGELVTINNVTRVNTSLAQNTGLQAASWTGVGQSWVSNVTAAGNAATLINGQLATIYGAYNTALATTYNVGLRAADVTGTSDTLKLAASGAGTSTNTFTINSTTATGVESISFAGTGTNDVTLTGVVGAATDLTSLTITGAGVNTISTQGLTQLATVSAGTSTGTNVVNVGTSLVNNFTYTGGTGADTLQATTSGQVRTGITLSGVETLRLDSGAAASTLAFAAAPGLTTVQFDTGAAGANAIIKTLANVGSFNNLNFIGSGTAETAANAMIFNGVTATGGFTGATDALAINFSNGGVTTTNSVPYRVGNINVAGVETFNINVADNTANARLAMGNLTSSALMTVNALSNGRVNTGNIDTGLANTNSIATINWSGVTGNAVSIITVGGAGNTLAAAINITAGAGGLTATIASAEVAADVLTFTGGNGNDTLNADVFGAVYAGNIIANGGSGNDLFVIGRGAAGAGSSKISGGAGGDSFIYNNGQTVANTISDLGLGSAVGTVENLEIAGAASGVIATVAVNISDTDTPAIDNFSYRSTSAAANTVLNAASGVNIINISGASASGGGATINAFATTSSTLTGSQYADLINGSTLADTIVNKGVTLIDSVRTSAGDVMTGGTGIDTFVLYGSNVSAVTPAAYALASRIADFAVGNDLLNLSLTIGNYAAAGSTSLAIQGQVGAASLQNIAQSTGATALVATTDLIKLTTGVADAGSVQGNFNAAIGTSTVTGYAAGDGAYVSYYDTTNSRAVVLLVNTTNTVNTTLETGDTVTLVGTMNMSAADYATFSAANLVMIA